MDVNQEVKQFIEISANYCRHRTDPVAAKLERCLHVLLEINDLDPFKTSNTSASNFYVSLHDLLNEIDVHSPLVWPGISVLQKVCDVNKTKMAVIQSYKFIPVLTRFLDESLPNDKLQQLLTALSDLTYGVKVAWQESHLPVLIEALTQVIAGNNKPLMSPALTTLVNLCYKNTPALYVLTRKVEIKAFLKSLAAMNDDLSVRVQACKLLMIFGELKGRIPAEDILRFVDVTINCVSEAYQTQNIAALRQIVDFFKDVNDDPQLRLIISRYPKIQEDSKRLIALLDTGEKLDLVAIVLEFITEFFKINYQKTAKLLEDLLTKITPWMLDNKTFIPVMKVLLMVTEVMESEPEDQLFELFPVDFLVAMLKPESILEDQKERVSLAVAVLTKVSTISPSFRQQILELINCEKMEDLFEKLFKSNFFHENCMSDESDTNQLCLQLIVFVSTLSAFSDDWKNLYSKLLMRNETLCAIAVAILNGNTAARLNAFRLTSTWDDSTLSSFCETMNEMRQISIAVCDNDASTRLEWVSISSREQRINELLQSFKTEANTSTVAELYEYKLSAMDQSERHLKTALDAADKRCTSLNHQLAQLRSTVARLHQSLFDTQYVLDGRTAEKADLGKQLQNLVSKTAQEKKIQSQKMKHLVANIHDLENTVKQQGTDIASKDGLLEEYQNKLLDMTQAFEAATTQCEEQKLQLANLVSQLEEMTLIKENLSKELKKCEDEIVTCKAQIEDCQAQNVMLQDTLTKSLEENSQKDELLADCERKLVHLENMREAIISVARARDL